MFNLRLIFIPTVMQHRVPSPREIVMHAQTVMQNALIKTKLEEQRENYRKRQDQQQQQHQQAQQRGASPVNSPAKQTMSPTPLAFTPTSVLRKMTADKEPEGANQSLHQLDSALPFSPTTNDHRNNYLNSREGRADSRAFACSESAIQLTNHNARQHGSGVLEHGASHSKSLHELNNNGSAGESALKAKYDSSLQQKKDTNNNSDLGAPEENDLVNELRECLRENTPAKESTLIDISDTNNNSPLILDKLLTEQFEIETIIVDNKTIGKIEENKILNSQNDEVVA